MTVTLRNGRVQLSSERGQVLRDQSAQGQKPGMLQHRLKVVLKIFVVFSFLFCLGLVSAVEAQDKTGGDEAGLGPVVTAYLGYLRNEQEVVDDRVSRREISRAYYRRNSNRIRALREMAIRIARASNNDYLPELEAVAADELGTLIERPPAPSSLHVGDVLNYTLRYLGSVRMVENFYLFARLDPYEQTELRKKAGTLGDQRPASGKGPDTDEIKTRARRVHNPG